MKRSELCPTKLRLVAHRPLWRVPLSLRVVAWLFIAEGILAFVRIVIGCLFQGTVSLDVGIFAFFVGRGLLRLSPGSRRWALIFSGISMAEVALIAILSVLPIGDNPRITFSGHPSPDSVGLHAAVMSYLVVMLLVLIWQCWVLTRADIRQLFAARPT